MHRAAMLSMKQQLLGLLAVALALVSAEEEVAHAPCGVHRACNDVDAQAQDAAQGLLSMVTVAHRPLVGKPTLGLQEPVTITSVSSHVNKQPALEQESDQAALAKHKPNGPEAGNGEAQTKAMNSGTADDPVTDADSKRNENGQVQPTAGTTNFTGKQAVPQALTKIRKLKLKKLAKTSICKPCEFKLYSDKNCTKDSAVSGEAGRMTGTVDKRDVNEEIKSIGFNKLGCKLWLYTESLPEGRRWESPRDRVCLQQLVDKSKRPIGKVLMATTMDETCQP
mmetsp:Transcript_53236/g.105793  ORF Transcript_53236/g.105793 Transcript_53236/m.105793 type:complete len:280 (-) Transcript_53236:81-920(-)